MTYSSNRRISHLIGDPNSPWVEGADIQWSREPYILRIFQERHEIDKTLVGKGAGRPKSATTK